MALAVFLRAACAVVAMPDSLSSGECCWFIVSRVFPKARDDMGMSLTIVGTVKRDKSKQMLANAS
jgi:hypothetical protein